MTRRKTSHKFKKQFGSFRFLCNSYITAIHSAIYLFISCTESCIIIGRRDELSAIKIKDRKEKKEENKFQKQHLARRSI